jgi:hypothetical protein
MTNVRKTTVVLDGGGGGESRRRLSSAWLHPKLVAHKACFLCSILSKNPSEKATIDFFVARLFLSCHTVILMKKMER